MKTCEVREISFHHTGAVYCSNISNEQLPPKNKHSIQILE